MEGSVINQICASMDSFFDTEKKIGDYIVRNPLACDFKAFY